MTCTKRRFRDEIAARLALSRIDQNGGSRAKEPRRAYYCTKCGGWHLTSKGRAA